MMVLVVNGMIHTDMHIYTICITYGTAHMHAGKKNTTAIQSETIRQRTGPLMLQRAGTKIRSSRGFAVSVWNRYLEGQGR